MIWLFLAIIVAVLTLGFAEFVIGWQLLGSQYAIGVFLFTSGWYILSGMAGKIIQLVIERRTRQ